MDYRDSITMWPGQIGHRLTLIRAECAHECRRFQPDEGGDEVPDHGHQQNRFSPVLVGHCRHIEIKLISLESLERRPWTHMIQAKD